MEIKINVPDGRRGNWEVKTFFVSIQDALFHNAVESGRLGRYIYPGAYKSLYRYEDGNSRLDSPIMSNTPAEVMDHMPFINAAQGDILIFGLGLGMVVQALIDKENVKSITVIEKDPDVIELIGNYYSGISKKVVIKQADALTYSDSNHYDAAWFDIWDEISHANLPEMQTLKKRWKKIPLRMCWAEKECKKILKNCWR